MPLAPQQIRKLRARLRPQHIRTREAEGRTIAYLEGWHVIAEANRIFGFDGWDRELIDNACVYTRQQAERFNAAYTARIRIKVRAGEHMKEIIASLSEDDRRSFVHHPEWRAVIANLLDTLMRTAIEHGVVLCRGEKVGLRDLPPAIRGERGTPAASDPPIMTAAISHTDGTPCFASTMVGMVVTSACTGESQSGRWPA